MMRKMLVAGLMLACVGSLDAIIRFKPEEKDYEYDCRFYEEEDTRHLAYAITHHPKVVITSDTCAARPKVLADYKNIVVRIDTSQLNRAVALAHIIIAYAEKVKPTTGLNPWLLG